MLTRRNLFCTLLAAPAIIKTPGLLMPISKPIIKYLPPGEYMGTASKVFVNEDANAFEIEIFLNELFKDYETYCRFTNVVYYSHKL